MSPAKRLLATLLLPKLSTGTPISRRKIATIPTHLHTPPFFPTPPRQQPPLLVSKRYSTAQSPNTKLYDYEAIKSLTKTYPRTCALIDVREPAEFAAGAIPTAVNIPIASSPDALTLSPEEFEDRFGFAKPELEKEVVFYCKAGIRSSAAAQVAVGVGYRRVGEYRGSWVDWEKRERGD
ncbi:Rhodanese-like domain-containing protein [Tuber indicum]|nr:Rhodanese-like domain-containing protein [Tuber indicum]